MGYRLNNNRQYNKIGFKSPITYVKERLSENKDYKQLELEKDYWADVFENLENYDGTPESQKTVRYVDERQ